jgi:hypothetical protein
MTMVFLDVDDFKMVKDTRGHSGGDKVLCEVARTLGVKTEMSRSMIQHALNLKSQANFRDRYLLPALRTGLIEMTIPDRPNSRMQKYRVTAKGRGLLG